MFIELRPFLNKAYCINEDRYSSFSRIIGIAAVDNIPSFINKPSYFNILAFIGISSIVIPMFWFLLK
jgi:hypothetical protein